MTIKFLHVFDLFTVSSFSDDKLTRCLELSKITPAFDDFNPPAKVTDDLFRIDLPLLMLYLDKHKINKNKCSPSLKNYLILSNNPDGLCSINDKCKDIIRGFVA